MTRQSTENISISSPGNIKNDCPLHGNDGHQSIQEQIVTIDVVEALQHFNVPNEIVKVLRTYYSFLKTEADSSNDINEDRFQKSVNTFLKEFEAMVSNVCGRRKSVEIIQDRCLILFIIVAEYHARSFIRRTSLA